MSLMRRQRQNRHAGRALAAAALLAVAQAGPVIAATATVSVSDAQVGVTPRYLGYNMGHYMSGSNTSAWTQYSGANAYRVWANASDYEPANPNYGDGVTTLSQFDADKTSVRASPESNAFIPWSTYNAHWGDVESGRNHVQLNYILPELQKLGVEPVMQLSRSTSFSYSGWGGRWEQWKFYYTVAFWAAKNYDVQRFQMYNEPDITAISISEWNDRLHVSSDAIKSAIEDVNRIYGKQLNWSMNAPVAASTVGSVDTWGATALQSNRTDYAGNATSYDIFDTYDVHRYNSLGSSFASDQQLFDTKIPTYNASGQNMNVTYTEFNRYTSSNFASRSDGLDTPQIAAEFGNIIPGAMSEDVYGMYAFKFGQTLWDHDNDSSTPDVPQKTGFHYVEDSGTYGIKGATRGAEVMRLAIKAFKGQRPRVSTNVTATNGNYVAASSYDGARGNYYYYVSNRDTANGYTTTLDVSGWNVAVGQVIGVQEVSANHLGAVSQYLTVPANKQLVFTQPLTSVTLLTLPAGTAVQTQTDLNPTADAFVSHANPAVNQLGAVATTSKIDRDGAGSNDDVAYMKFNLGTTSKARVSRAFLNVTGVNATNSTSTILHAYGILNDAWTETGITWNNAPDLAGASDAKLANVGTDAFPVGQLTWNNTSHEWGIDVTDFVRSHPDADLSFALVREQRFLGDADTSQIQINTRENSAGKPRLSLFLAQNPTYIWNKNAGGTWSSATNWDAGAPTAGGAGAVALLSDYITSAHTVTFETATTLGELRFDGLNSWTLSGTPTLTMDGGAGAPSAIRSFKGGHKLDVPVSLTTATTVEVASGTLNVTKPITGAAGMTKTGAGMLTLSAANTFGPSNALTISAGAVNVNGSLSHGVTVNAGGTLSGTGTVSGAVTSSGTIAPGGVGVASSPLSLNGGVTLNAGSSVDFDFAVGTSDRLNGSGALTLSGGAGTITVNLNDLGGMADGDYTLIQHSNALADLNALVLGTHPSGTYSFLNNAGAIVLHVTGVGAAPILWSGSVDGTWDVNNHANWSGNATGKFNNGDRVVFDDSATGPTTITVASGGVSPGQIHVINAGVANGGKDYVIGGPGAIGGNGDLIKDGAGTVTLAGVNTFTGHVTVNAGTLSLLSGAAVGSVADITLGGATLDFQQPTTLSRPLVVNASSAINVNANDVTYSGTLSGSGPLTKLGSGMLSVTGGNGGFAGGWDIEQGTLRATSGNALGAGPITIANATLRLENVAFSSVPNMTFADGATLQSTGSTQYTKSNFPATALGTSAAPVNVNWSSMNAGDVLSFGSAIRSTSTGTSYATINVNPNGEAGVVQLTSGGLSAGNTFGGSWTLGGGFLQIGPNTTSSSECMNALGFKNSDAKQANAITITGGALIGAVNAPQAANVGTTPAFFRAGVTLAGGAIGSTGLNASYGGDFATSASTTSRVLVYDPLIAGVARDVNLVAGAAGSLNNAASTSWAGTLIVTPGALATGGAFNVNRTGGTTSVTGGATLQIDPGATVNLGGALDALSDGVRHVNVVNNSAASGFNVTSGTKNVGDVDGTGATTVSSGATLITYHLRQAQVTINGAAKVRDNGSTSGTSVVTTLALGANTTLDLRDNDMILRSASRGSWNGAAYTGVTGLVAGGYNDGDWGGKGIVTTVTSAVYPNTLASLGVATAGDIGASGTVWSGQSVSSNDVLVMFTYAGDANLDGMITGDDYFRIDSAFPQGAHGWLNGDFNYDGTINGDDYFLIDSNFHSQGASLATSSSPLGAVVAVPEPAACVFAMIGALALRRRGRR